MPKIGRCLMGFTENMKNDSWVRPGMLVMSLPRVCFTYILESRDCKRSVEVYILDHFVKASKRVGHR